MYRLLLVYALLSCCTGEPLAHTSPKKILAFEGADVILPCSFNITASSDFPTVEWSKKGLQPDVIFLYRDDCETYEMKNPAFEYRTSLIPKELKDGNISLRISNVQLSDTGKYQCMRLWKNAPRDITAVQLIVGAVSEPKLSVVSTECGGVTLQCEVNYSLPELEIKFLDDQGNNILAEDTKIDHDASGFYTMRRRMTLLTATNSVTCRVHQPDFNLVRDTQILIPADCVRSCFLTTIITAGGTILVLLYVCGLAVWLWRRRGKSAEGQNLSVTRWASDQRTLSITIENSPLEQSDRTDMADNVGNSAIETLVKQVAHLKLELHERDETIRQLLSPAVYHRSQPILVCSASRSSLNAPQTIFPVFIHSLETNDHIPNPIVSTKNNLPEFADIFQNKGPKPVIQRENSNPTAAQRNSRRNSSPAVLSAVLSSSSLASSPKKKLSCIGLSVSDSYSQPEPNHTKLQRRHSSGILSTTLSANRYTILTGVKEESEPLISCEQNKNFSSRFPETR